VAVGGGVGWCLSVAFKVQFLVFKRSAAG